MARTHTLPSPPPLAELIARGPLALFLDFDGTLVEIAPDPDAIHVPQDLALRLERLRERVSGRLALVSGRALDNLFDHVGPLRVARAGSHGAHRQHADGSVAGREPAPLDAAVVADLQAFAEAQGLRYETKAHGGALHYRTRPECESAVQAFASEIAANSGLIVKRGKAVAELVRPGADKAGAVRAFMALEPFAGAIPVFIGDDVTDEDGFAGAIEFGGFGVAVGERISDKARYRLDSVTAVHNWLEIR